MDIIIIYYSYQRHAGKPSMFLDNVVLNGTPMALSIAKMGGRHCTVIGST